jgi:hypothetical protein
MDVRDLARIVDLCLEKDGLGFQVFNATSDEIIANEPTTSFLTKHAQRTPMARELEGFEAPMHNWQKYAPGRDRSPAKAR